MFSTISLGFKQHPIRVYSIFLLLISLSIPLAVSVGTATIEVDQAFIILYNFIVDNEQQSTGNSLIIWELRFPRVLMACIAGAGLAMAGLTLQTITNNSLADPHLLGISSGAVLGAVLVTMHIGEVIGQYTLPLAAFLGAFLATAIILFVNQRFRLQNASQLLMCGIALSFVFMSAANLALFLGDVRSGHQVIFWMLGGLGLSRWSTLAIPAMICIIGGVYLALYGRQLNALLLGDETAESLGINVKQLRIKMFILSALITSIIVAHCGAIGFVGLMIPHIGRYFLGADVSRLIPLSALLGALFLLWVDVLSRTLITNQELPIGIITGFIGGLYFISLLIKATR